MCYTHHMETNRIAETASKVEGYLVETSFYGEAWQVRSGHASKASAMKEVRQCGPKWRKEGHAVRVVEHS